MPKVNFILNGKPVTASYEPGMTFLEVLREECRITSAKNGCAPEGTCGCCAVLFDAQVNFGLHEHQIVQRDAAPPSVGPNRNGSSRDSCGEKDA